MLESSVIGIEFSNVGLWGISTYCYTFHFVRNVICEGCRYCLDVDRFHHIKTQRGKKGWNDKSINEELDGVHLVTGFVFAARRSTLLAYISLTLTTCKLVAWERQTEAVKDLEPAVNGPWQFAFAAYEIPAVLALFSHRSLWNHKSRIDSKEDKNI